MDTICPICNNSAPPRLIKSGIQYFQCSSCKTLFSGVLDNDNKIGGMFEAERNETQNHLRLQRVDEMTLGINKEFVNILDFGCGNGLLIEDLRKHGYPNTFGYDAYNEKFSILPDKSKYSLIIAVEVIEHTSHPFVEVDVMNRSLIPGGVVMIETSFTNVADEEGIALDNFFYVSPEAGHSTIFSHHGLDLLFVSKGFLVVQHFNRNVRVYKKPYVK